MRQVSLLALALSWACAASAADPPQVQLYTSKGVIVIELDVEKSPRTVRNFLSYVENQYYDQMIFHRVIDDWVIQSGGYTEDLVGYETEAPIRNEAVNGLKNLRGTIAMARGGDPHSADSQFFINLDDNASLDHKARTLQHYGYCVFGRVIEGMEFADAIGNVETREQGGHKNLPIEAVLIERAVLVE